MSASVDSPPTSTPTAPEPDRSRRLRRPGHAMKAVFAPAAAIAVLFVLWSALFPSQTATTLATVNTTVVNGIGWYYVLLVTAFVGFAVFVGLSRYGDVRLGPDDEDAQYGVFSWFAMLFAAGMGIGLVFWGVAEPLNHYAAPAPNAPTGDDAARAQSAFNTTFLHWGLHAWAIYVVVGLSVAYAVHRKGRPVSIRWALEPLLGKRTDGLLGDVIDVVAIVGTLFGVATSLGFGVTQLAAGLDFLGLVDGDGNIGLYLGLVAGISALAIISVVSGLDKGIKILSNTNLVLAGVLMVAILLLGPSLFVLRELVQNVGSYIQNFVSLSFRTFPYAGGDGESWLSNWTTYYWGWWISWSPFVGVFIARISRGRTVREFVAGVLLVPTTLTFLWFSILGGTALYRQIFGAGDLVGADGAVDTETSLFQVVDNLPGGPILAGLFILLIVIFFVTSADSGALVIDMLAHGGDPNPPVWSRVFWGVLAGSIAGVLLFVGWSNGELTDGLTALQTMSILAAAPFSLVMIGMCVATARALSREHRATVRRQREQLTADLADDLFSDDRADAALTRSAPSTDR